MNIALLAMSLTVVSGSAPNSDPRKTERLKLMMMFSTNSLF